MSGTGTIGTLDFREMGSDAVHVKVAGPVHPDGHVDGTWAVMVDVDSATAPPCSGRWSRA